MGDGPSRQVLTVLSSTYTTTWEGIAMRKRRSQSGLHAKPSTIAELRRRFDQSQTAFGERLRSSAMVVSRWERGTQEPTAGSYIELGNLAGNPLCSYFWSRAG